MKLTLKFSTFLTGLLCLARPRLNVGRVPSYTYTCIPCIYLVWAFMSARGRAQHCR